MPMNNALTVVLFPHLTCAGGFLSVSNTIGTNAALTFIDLHSLLFVGGYFKIQGCTPLTMLVVAALTYVAQYFLVDSNTMALTYLSLVSLTYVGGYFFVDYNYSLDTLVAPSLVKIAGVCALCNGMYAVDLCGNSGTLSFSSAVSHAAAGQPCYLTQTQCIGTITTCQ